MERWRHVLRVAKGSISTIQIGGAGPERLSVANRNTTHAFVKHTEKEYTRGGIIKLKRPFPPTASAHPMPPCPLMPAPGVGPHAPRQGPASAGCRRQAAGPGGWGRAACTAGAADES